MFEVVALLISLDLSSKVKDLMDQSGKDTFNKEEVSKFLAEASMKTMADLSAMKEKEEAKKNSIDQLSPEDLINKGLDKLGK